VLRGYSKHPLELVQLLEGRTLAWKQIQSWNFPLNQETLLGRLVDCQEESKRWQLRAIGQVMTCRCISNGTYMTQMLNLPVVSWDPKGALGGKCCRAPRSGWGSLPWPVMTC